MVVIDDRRRAFIRLATRLSFFLFDRFWRFIKCNRENPIIFSALFGRHNRWSHPSLDLRRQRCRSLPRRQRQLCRGRGCRLASAEHLLDRFRQANDRSGQSGFQVSEDPVGREDQEPERNRCTSGIEVITQFDMII